MLDRVLLQYTTAARIVTIALVVGLANAACADLSQPGPYAAGWTEVSVPRPGGGSFTAKLFYPATSGGDGAPYDGSGAPYPGISFGHGFFQSVEQYDSTLEHLASHGYLVIATRSQGGLFPSHSQYAVDMRACLTWLETQHDDPGAALYQQVAVDRFGMSGHSMGGGASILATAQDPRVKVLANMAAADTNPSAIDAMPNITVPVCLIAGDQDGLVPVESHGQLMYDNGNPPLQLPVIVGGFHCGFVDGWFFGCDSGGISRAAQLALTRQLLTQFFNLYLKDDQSVWRQVWGPERDQLAGVQTQAAPGFSLLPGSSELAAAGGTSAAIELTVTNEGPLPDSYALFAEDNTWDVTLTPTQTAVLDVGASSLITIEISVPAEGTLGEDTALISARSGNDGGTRVYAEVTTTRLNVCRGDSNCDEVINWRDIDYFVAAQNDNVSGWTALFAPAAPPCPFANNDVNADGTVNWRDVDPFVTLQNTTCGD